MRRQDDRLLAAQQTRQYRPSAGCEVTREVGGQQCQRARQDVRQDQVMATPVQPAPAVSGGMADPHQAGDPVAGDIVAGDHDRPGIDVARQHPVAQQLGRGDRQYAGAAADIERMGDPAPSRQRLQRDQAAAGRGVLAGAKRGRRVERDPDRPGRDAAAMVRAVDKKAADAQGRKGELVLREPVAVGQFPFADLDQFAPGRGGGER